MKSSNYISLDTLCEHYEIEVSFINQLNEMGIIEIINIEHSNCIHSDRIKNLEKIIRMNRDLQINLEGIDTILNLLDKIEELQSEIQQMKQKLHRLDD